MSSFFSIHREIHWEKEKKSSTLTNHINHSVLNFFFVFQFILGDSSFSLLRRQYMTPEKRTNERKMFLMCGGGGREHLCQITLSIKYSITKKNETKNEKIIRLNGFHLLLIMMMMMMIIVKDSFHFFHSFCFSLHTILFYTLSTTNERKKQNRNLSES